MQEIPREELEADEHEKIISVFHFQKEVSRTHGVPFRFVVKPVRLFFSESTHLNRTPCSTRSLQIRRNVCKYE